jgi:hypothetical protein
VGSALRARAPGRILVYVTVTMIFAVVGLVARAVLSGSPDPSARALVGPNPFSANYDPAALSAFPHNRLSPYDSIIARAVRPTVELYARPGGHPMRSLGSVPHSSGTRLVFLVKERRRGWLDVYLPIRPNQSTAWVRSAAMRLVVTDYRAVAQLRSHRLTVWRGPHRVLRAPIGVGRAVTPTPAGRYYLVYLLRPAASDTVFGSYAFGLSAYSDVYTSFAGGDGEIGLHGTDDPAGIGTNVSHGCIRVNNRVITRLATMLPLGTPLMIER